jgi:hypothetical protein
MRHEQMNSLRSRRFVLAGLLIAGGAFLSACGGGSPAVFKPGPLVCDTLSSQSYQYQVQATLQVDAMAGTPPPSTGAFDPAHTFTETIQGAVSDGKYFQVTVDNNDGHSDTIFQASQLDNNVGYTNLGDGWNVRDVSTAALIKYFPPEVCSALAPDVDTSTLGTAQAEQVNGIASQRFAFTNLPTQFFTRDTDYGAGSDAASYLHDVNGMIWVANSGGYPTKLDMTGTGQYPNGQPLKVRLTFQVSDVGKSVDLKAPDVSTPS